MIACACEGMGAPFFVYPSDTVQKKNEVNAAIVSTDAAVQSCGALPPEVRAAWNVWLDTWRTFYATELGWGGFGAWQQFVTAERYQSDLVAWQDKLTAFGCVLAAPKVEPPADASTLIKLVAGAVTVAAVAYVAAIVIPRVLPKR